MGPPEDKVGFTSNVMGSVLHSDTGAIVVRYMDIFRQRC